MTEQNLSRAPRTSPPRPGDTETPPVDGRTARRDRNRTSVLDAVIELFSEENLSPGVHEVAERSGVSLRSVYRYFEDSDALIASAIERQFERARPSFQIDALGTGPLEDRIVRMVDARVALFEQVRVVYRAACIRGGTDPQVHAGLQRSRRRLAEQVHGMFASELEESGSHVGLSIDLLLQFDALEHLMTVHGLDAGAVRATTSQALRHLLAR